MPSTDPTPAPNGDRDQRQKPEAAERAASAQQPKSFSDDAMTDKVVQVDPIGPDDSAIKGLDSKKRPAGQPGSA